MAHAPGTAMHAVHPGITDRSRTDGHKYRRRYEWDGASRLTSVEFSDGSTYSLAYDDRGLVRQLGPLVSSIQWTLWGAPEEIAYANGIVDRRAYDARRQPTRTRATSDDGELVRDLEYAYDSAGQLTVRTDHAALGTASDSSASFTYDALHQLATSARPGDGATTTFAFGPRGNLERTERTTPGAPSVVHEFASGVGSDRLSTMNGVPVVYDDAGRIEQLGASRYQWRPDGRLAASETDDVGALTVQYDYRGEVGAWQFEGPAGSTEVRNLADDEELRDGRRVRYLSLAGERLARLDGAVSPALGVASADEVPVSVVAANGWRSPERLVLAALVVLASILAASRSKRRFVRPLILVGLSLSLITCGNDPREITSLPTATSIFFYDMNGNVVATTNRDGEVTSRSLFSEYGAREVTLGTPEPAAFLGREAMPDGSYFIGPRVYLPSLGRFLQPDPADFSVGTEEILASAFSSSYAYADGAPTNLSDDDGFQANRLARLPNRLPRSSGYERVPRRTQAQLDRPPQTARMRARNMRPGMIPQQGTGIRTPPPRSAPVGRSSYYVGRYGSVGRPGPTRINWHHLNQSAIFDRIEPRSGYAVSLTTRQHSTFHANMRAFLENAGGRGGSITVEQYNSFLGRSLRNAGVPPGTASRLVNIARAEQAANRYRPTDRVSIPGDVAANPNPPIADPQQSYFTRSVAEIRLPDYPQP